MHFLCRSADGCRKGVEFFTEDLDIGQQRDDLVGRQLAVVGHISQATNSGTQPISQQFRQAATVLHDGVKFFASQNA